MGVSLLLAKTMMVDRKLLADETLVAATLGGEGAAFEELVRRYERPARAVCGAILRDQHLACDAAQDAFVEAYRGLKGLKAGAAFGGWVLTIARNRALRMRKGRRPVVELGEVGAAAVVEGDEALLRAVAALPEQERVVVMLRFFDGLEVGEIGGMLSRPVSTVTKQLSRAYARLRGVMGKERNV
jgi:RNA polymerase sigma factor (sigma-70 family)